MHRVNFSRHQQTRFELDCGLVILLLKIHHLQANPADAVIENQVLRSVIAMPGLLQVVPFMQRVGTVARTH